MSPPIQIGMLENLWHKVDKVFTDFGQFDWMRMVFDNSTLRMNIPTKVDQCHVGRLYDILDEDGV